MPTTAQHGLLTRLLDYVVEQGKEIDPRAYVLTGASDFRRFPKDLAGLPGVSVPVGLDPDGLPLGLQLIGKPWEEGELLNHAYVLERAAGFVSKPSKWW